MQKSDIESFLKCLNMAEDIVVLTGAGVSTASGLTDFKSLYDSNLTFEGFKPIEILSHEFFESNPKVFYDFVMHYFSSPREPNVCHKFIKKLESFGKNVTVITQNIDGLHQKAGSKDVIELHGTIQKWHCTECQKAFTLDQVKQKTLFHCDEPGCNGIVRPDVVLYNEAIPCVEEAWQACQNADTMIVMGTSLATDLPYNLIKKAFRGYTLISIDKDFVSFPFRQNPKLRIKGNLEKVCAELMPRLENVERSR